MRASVFDTRITRLFGIRHPILCGGLMWLADGRYVAAVVNAGCMGFITARSFPDVGAFGAELDVCAALTEGKPFGVNISVSRQPGVNEMLKPHVDLLCERGVRFVETSGSSPSHILPQLHEAGVKVLHKVPAVRYALAAQRDGVDAIAVVGAECGGHPGFMMVGSMIQGTLGPMKLDVPVVLGGGIGTGRQVAAALMMGCDGVLLGTRMVVSEEIWAHPDYKRRVVEGDGSDSAVVMQLFKRHHRVLDNEAARAVMDLERRGVEDFSAYEPHVRGTRTREAYASGDVRQGMLDYGQAACFATAVEPVEAIVDGLIDDAAAAMRRFEGLRIGGAPMAAAGE